MICFCDIYVIEAALRASFLNSSLASSFCPSVLLSCCLRSPHRSSEEACQPEVDCFPSWVIVLSKFWDKLAFNL